MYLSLHSSIHYPLTHSCICLSIHQSIIHLHTHVPVCPSKIIFLSVYLSLTLLVDPLLFWFSLFPFFVPLLYEHTAQKLKINHMTVTWHTSVSAISNFFSSSPTLTFTSPTSWDFILMLFLSSMISLFFSSILYFNPSVSLSSALTAWARTPNGGVTWRIDNREREGEEMTL